MAGWLAAGLAGCLPGRADYATGRGVEGARMPRPACRVLDLVLARGCVWCEV